MEKDNLNGYNLTRNWYNFRFENPDKVRAIHSDLYFYIVDLWNRLGQKEKIGLPTSVTMQCLGIGSYNTYKKALNEIIEFGFIILVSDSKNQHQSKIIALSVFDNATNKAPNKALDKAHINAVDSIIKQENNEKINNSINSKSHYSEKSEFDNNEKNNTTNSLNTSNPKKEKKGSAEKKEKEVIVGWHSCVGEWQKFYFSKFNSKPSFGAIEAKHLKSIYNRLKNKVNDKNEIWNEETALEYLKDFLFKAWNDNWLKANFLIPNLSSKFDAIINKTGTNENQWQTGGKKVARFSIAEATKRPTFDTNRPTKETDKSGDINLIHIN